MQYMLRPPVSVARAFVDAINAHALDELTKLMSNEHRFIDSLGAMAQDREKMRNGWAAYFRMVPDYTVFVEEVFSRGPVVVRLGTARGAYAKDGQVAAKNFWHTPAAWRAQIKGNKVAAWRVDADNEPMRPLMRGDK